MKKQNKKHSNLLYKLMCISTVVLAAIVAACLLVYCFPSLPGQAANVCKDAVQTCGQWIDSSRTALIQSYHDSKEKQELARQQHTATTKSEADEPLPTTMEDHTTLSDHKQTAPTDHSVSQQSSSNISAASQTLAPSGSLGNITDLDNFDVPEDISSYYIMLDTAMGSMVYYNQGDSRWAQHLYGGKDPLARFGCGPTAISMLISSFSEEGGGLSPVEIANWATEHGYFAPGHGSSHTLIENALNSYGFEVESVKNRTAEHTSELLQNGHILVALMKHGSLTKSAGHFILITKLLDNGNVWIADPNSYENSQKEWDLNQLLSELKIGSGGGGPLWSVRTME